jgi:hypothetical protein
MPPLQTCPVDVAWDTITVYSQTDVKHKKIRGQHAGFFTAKSGGT